MNLQQQNILDNYHHPLNQGKPDSFTHHMRLENFTCGDAIDIYLSVHDSRVADARFEGEGCSISIATASMLTEELKGKQIAEVEAMTIDDLLKMLGIELTPSRRKCAYLSLEAAQSALKVISK